MSRTSMVVFVGGLFLACPIELVVYYGLSPPLHSLPAHYATQRLPFLPRLLLAPAHAGL